MSRQGIVLSCSGCCLRHRLLMTRWGISLLLSSLMIHLSCMRPWDPLLGVITSATTISSWAKCAATTTHILMLLVKTRVSTSTGIWSIARMLRNGCLRPIACQVSCRVIGRAIIVVAITTSWTARRCVSLDHASQGLFWSLEIVVWRCSRMDWHWQRFLLLRNYWGAHICSRYSWLGIISCEFCSWSSCCTSHLLEPLSTLTSHAANIGIWWRILLMTTAVTYSSSRSASTKPVGWVRSLSLP